MLTSRLLATSCLLPWALAAVAASSAQAAPSGDPKADELMTPPSMVLVPGGRTYIGSDKDDIQELIEADESAAGALRSLDAETPQAREDLPDFFLMLTECSNEQYAEFVRATGHRPPFDWAHPEDLNNGRMSFLESEQKKKRELAEQGTRYTPEKFYADEWWDRNWQDQRWQVPEGRELHPVGRVDFADATAYCIWAGLRLPTEFEFQRAARGDQKWLYPWGDTWEIGKFAVASDVRRSTSEPVGSMPAGASPFGIHDLAGNHWEWTSSPYLPYERYRANKYKIGKKQQSIPANWNGNQRVVMGGSYQNSSLVARVTTRRPTERTQLTNAMGFRAAASTRPAQDIASSLNSTTVKPSDIRSGTVFATDLVLGMDSWSSKPSASDKAPAGYSLITGFEHVAFVPAAELPTRGNMTELEKSSLAEAIHLGFLTLSQPTLEPALEAGTYFVSFRAEGNSEWDEDSGDPRPALDVAEQVDIEKDNLLLFDVETGELVHHMPTNKIEMVNPRDPASIAFIKRKAWQGSGEDRVQIEEDWLVLDAIIPTQLSSRAVRFPLEFKVSPEVSGIAWRK